jgi:hypothetical protein
MRVGNCLLSHHCVHLTEDDVSIVQEGLKCGYLPPAEGACSSRTLKIPDIVLDKS